MCPRTLPLADISLSPEALAGVPLERIEAEITELAGHINAATCRWLCLVAELDRREGWASWGAKSCAHWLSWRCSVSPNAAREQVRVARRLAELPAITAAFAAGELSFSKVRALSRVAAPETEEELLGIARHATAAQIEVMVRSYRRACRAAELAEANVRHARRRLDYHYDEDGSLVLRARLSPEEGAVVLAALQAAASEIESPGENVSAVTPPAHPLRSATRNADALVIVAERSLAAGSATGAGRARPQVIVHADADALSEGATASAELDDGMGVPPETARRLACDASVVTLVERDGEPLAVGRKTRSVPAGMRRALEARDRRCRFPGCEQRRHLDAHHVRHWADGGETDLDNLLLLCRFHHRFVHEGRCRVAVNDGAFAFTLPGGRTISSSQELSETDADALRRVNLELGLEIDHETIVPLWAGEAMDYDIAVGWMMRAAEEAA